MREAGSALEMGRLEAPVRDKPGIDQHQRRAVHQDVREIGSDIKKLQRRLAVTRYEAPFESLWARGDREPSKSVLNSLFRSRISSEFINSRVVLNSH